MSTLPTGWAKTPIDAIALFNPKTIADDSLQCAFSPMQYLGTRFRASMGFEVRTWGEVKKAYVHFQKGDVIVAKVTPCFENGKAGVAPDIPNGIGAGSSEFCIFRPAQGIDERYLLAWLSTDDFRRRATVAMTGSVGLKRVPKDVFLSEELPLAPVAEQRRIADKLDTVLTRVDALNDRLARITPLLKRFRQSVLTAATSGQLTEDWRVKNQISEIWTQTNIGELATVIRGASPRPAGDPLYFGGDVPWITVGEITKDEDKWLLNTSTFLTEEGRLRSRQINSGTLLLTNSGATLGVPKISLIDGCINDGSVAFLNISESLKNYLYWFLKGQTDNLRNLNRGAAQPNLNTGIVKAITLGLPLKEEQTEIVRRVEILFAYADRLEARLQTARTAAERLTPALLAKAFRGELVPQDPNDEPATELLRRLREARVADASVKKPRGRKTAVA